MTKMTSMLTDNQLHNILPTINGSAEWLPLLVSMFDKYEINTVERVAMFLAQTGHETGDFRVLIENLNYDAKGLLATFKTHFNAATAMLYARKPEKIANRVYANRMGNGPECSGDGWRYRGKGLIQLTGKENYVEFAEAIGKTLADATIYVTTKAGAIEAACWFWKEHSINALCDHENVLAVTKMINGGTIGLADRQARYANAKKVLIHGIIFA